MLSLLESQNPSTNINIAPTPFHYTKIIGQHQPEADLSTNQLLYILIDYHNNNNISYISSEQSNNIQVSRSDNFTHFDMPQRTPARSSPFHNQQQPQQQPQQQHAQQQHASSSVYHQEPQQFDLREEQQQYSGGGTASSSSNANSERSNRIASNHNHQQHRSSMLNLNNVNNNGGDMYLFQSNASVNNTCNSTGSSTTPPTSFQFHNMNNSQTFSSNKRRKQADSTNGGNTSSSASTNNTTTGIENSIFYHMETDFKRKHVDKKRLIWTNELHELFVNAVAQLGLNEARPKEILELMNLPDLTTTHIKSHLQKYRQQVKKGIVPLGISQSNNEMGTNSESETSDNEVLNEDVIVKQEAVSTATSPFNNNQSSHQVYSFNSTTNPNQSSSSNIASSSQNFNSLINDTNSDQVNYIKNILLHFNQASANNSNNETGPSGSHNSFVPSSSSSSSASFQRPTQHVTFANSITNNNITTVNQPHFHLGDGSNILRNCHLLTSANSLSEFLVLLQEVCKAESDMAAIFNGLPVRSTHDLNLIVEGFRIGFICGMKYKP